MKRLLGILIFLAAPLWAVEPDEILSDPALETRARDISAGLRCPVCQNESIDESDATVARDLRLLVRERLLAGDSDPETVDFIVARYGEFVLLRPQAGGANLILWGIGPAVLLFVLAGFFKARRRPPRAEAVGLSSEEEARIEALLKD